MEIEATCVSKNLDETVRLQSEKREEWIGEIRGERLQGLQRAQVSLPPWPAHQPRRFREKRVSGDPLQPDRTGGERRQFLPDLQRVCGKKKMEERTGWRGQNESQTRGK